MINWSRWAGEIAAWRLAGGAVGFRLGVAEDAMYRDGRPPFLGAGVPGSA